MLALHGTARGAASWPRIVANWGHLIPRYPGPDVVPLARVPAPPLLRAAEPEGIRAWRCACAYRVVIKHVYGWCGAMPQEPLRSAWAPTPAVLRAARELTARNRSPTAWCAFSAHVWLAYHGNKRRQPPLGWVYSPKRIAEREAWFASEHSRTNVGRVHIAPAQRELVLSFEALRVDLLALPPNASEEKVRATIERVFPAGSYDKLVAEANDQVQERINDLERRVQRGEFVW